MAKHGTPFPTGLTLAFCCLALAVGGCSEAGHPQSDAALEASQREAGSVARADGSAAGEPTGSVDSPVNPSIDGSVDGLDAGPAPTSAGADGSATSGRAHDGSLAPGASPPDGGGITRDLGLDPNQEPPVASACASSKLYQTPDDAAARGPWPVGVKTVRLPLAGLAAPLTVELWYPAKRGSEAGKLAERYDLTSLLPSGQASKLRPEDSAPQRCDCYRDLPIDTEHGPYPAVIYVHGTGSFRTASLSLMTHWASRGFVVIAADHLGLFVQDFLAASSLGECPGSGIATSLPRDLDAELLALASTSSEFAFLGSAVDRTRIALSGHGPGAQAIAQASTKPNVLVELPLAPTAAVGAAPQLASTVMIAGTSDTVAGWPAVQLSYATTPAPKRLVGIRDAEHFDLTEVCSMKSARGETPTELGAKRGICGMWLLDAVARCHPQNEREKTLEAIRYVTTATLEEALHCRAREHAFDALQARYPQVTELETAR